ncbi:28S ribosomal protein S9, mitochondrial [Trichoplax sp. H2]|nr:28S ribosomal protein S9, mitochondrial [Trichoplax sp. H2]|eukprot:RDD45863.1 28S ribosomal protein S9, mitochondrial [Trichoplax sp. H2]
MTSLMHMVGRRKFSTGLSSIFKLHRMDAYRGIQVWKSLVQTNTNRLITRQYSRLDTNRNEQQSRSIIPEERYKNEIAAFERGKRRLALMMEKDPETFTDQDIEEALAYLLPSSLFAKDARPIMKHPLELLPKIQEKKIDKDGRPFAAGYYTGFPAFYNTIHEIGEREELLMSLSLGKEVDRLADEVTQDLAPADFSQDNTNLSFRWLSSDQMKDMLQEDITDRQYDYLIARLERLQQFPNSNRVKDFMDKYRKNVEHRSTKVKIRPLSVAGVSYNKGKRKTAVANIQIQEGTGNVTINDKSLVEYFQQLLHREQVLYPLLVLNLTHAFDITCSVRGGGLSGQAGAIRLGIARALLSFNEAYKETLDEYELLHRDPRIVERKKPGQKKARRKFAWVKR